MPDRAAGFVLVLVAVLPPSLTSYLWSALACEADLEHKAKATADKLASKRLERTSGVLEYWNTLLCLNDTRD